MMKTALASTLIVLLLACSRTDMTPTTAATSPAETQAMAPTTPDKMIESAPPAAGSPTLSSDPLAMPAPSTPPASGAPAAASPPNTP